MDTKMTGDKVGRAFTRADVRGKARVRVVLTAEAVFALCDVLRRENDEYRDALVAGGARPSEIAASCVDHWSFDAKEACEALVPTRRVQAYLRAMRDAHDAANERAGRKLKAKSAQTPPTGA